MRITVFGKPVTQGSFIRTRYSMRSSNGDTLKPWRDNVRSTTLDAMRAPEGFGSWAGFGTAPVTVDIRFTFARPASHYGTGRNANVVKASAPPFPSSHALGDIDKLARACLDALTDAGTFTDDSQVVQLTACKVFVGGLDALDRPGAVIVVQFAAVPAPTGAAPPDGYGDWLGSGQIVAHDPEGRRARTGQEGPQEPAEPVGGSPGSLSPPRHHSAPQRPETP